MQSLPTEVLHLVVGNLDRASYWPFARTCKVLYEVIRPSLFRVTAIKLSLAEDRVVTAQLELCLEILGGSSKTQVAGGHVASLFIIFKYNGDEGCQSTTDVMEALGRLLRLTASVRDLVIDGLPDCASWYEDGDADHLAGIQRFKQSLRQLSNLHSLECAAGNREDSHEWLHAILPSLPISLHKLILMPDFEHSNREALQPNPSAQFLGFMKDLYFSCPQPGQTSDDLLSSILDNSPLLSTIWIGEQCLTVANVTALFGSERQYEHLTLDTVDIPHVAKCRQSLYKQSNLRYLDARCGGEFLYYLPFLPPALETLKLSIRVFDDTTLFQEQTLDDVWSQVKTCLEFPSWCPQLTRIHIDLETQATGDDYDDVVEEALHMRDELLVLLGNRETIPSTNEDFWSFNPDLSEAEEGWTAGLKEIKRRLDLKVQEP